MIAAISFIAEQRIREALSRGDFDDLAGAGEPLNLEEDANVPEDLRMAYKLLKNGGYLEAADETARDGPLFNLGDMLPANREERVTLKQMRKLQVVEARFGNRGGRALKLDADDAYHGKVVGRMTVAREEDRK